ncbi:MAG TPA: hypothetical protein VGS79_19365 [Puia sp.]|nr:hypothetical protein [Puia sp.]
MSTQTKIYVQYILSALFVLLLFPPHFFLYPGQGPGPSAEIALHLARKYRLIFGKDIVVADGPLGILDSRLPIAVGLSTYLFFDLYFLVTLFFAFRKILRDHFHVGVVAFMLLAITINMHLGMADWFFLILLFYLLAFLREPSRFTYLAQAGLLAVIGFYCRADIGILGMVLFLSILIYGFARRKLTGKQFIWSALLFLLVAWVAGNLLHVNIRGYITGSLHFTAHYGEARFQPPDDKEQLFLHLAMEVAICLLYWIICLLFLLVLKRELLKRTDDLVVCAVIGLTAFVYFKSGFIRTDDGQIVRFFGIVPLVTAFFYLYIYPDRWKKVSILCCWIVLALSVLAVNLPNKRNRPYSRLPDLSYFSIKARDVRTYLSELWKYNRVSAELERKVNNPDNELRRAIGGLSADIIPWEVSKIYFNGLRYAPRPVIQSYCAYSSWLDSLNYEKYTSLQAPDRVLLSFDSMDGHFPFFDEARTKLALLNGWDALTEIDGELVLKNARRHRLTAAGQETVDVRLGEDIPIKQNDGLRFSRFFIRYDGAGRLGRVLDQPPGLKITLTLDNDSSYTYRISRPVLEDGIIVNKYVDDKEEFQLLMQANGHLTPNIRKIRIQADSVGKGFIRKVVMVSTFYTFGGEGAGERRTDSLGIAGLFDRYRPVAAAPHLSTRDSLRYGIDEFQTFSQFIKLRGWAFRKKEADSDLLIQPVLESRDNYFELPVERQAAGDSATKFLSVTAKSLLPPGDYELGLVSWHRGDTARQIIYTDHYLLLRSSYKIEELPPMAREQQGDVDLKYKVDRAVTWKGRIYIDGWAYPEVTDPGKTTTHIILRSDTRTYRFTVDVRKRKDVAADSQKPWALYSGFTANIPEDQLIKDKYMLGIEQTWDNGRKKSLMFTGPTVTIGSDDVVIPTRAVFLPPSGDFLAGIDHFDDEQEYLSISGWAIRKMKEVAGSTIDLVFKMDNAVYIARTQTDKRTDLTAHYNNGFNLDNGGFLAKVSKEFLPAGRYQVGLWVHPKDRPGSVKFLSQSIVKK